MFLVLTARPLPLSTVLHSVILQVPTQKETPSCSVGLNPREACAGVFKISCYISKRDLVGEALPLVEEKGLSAQDALPCIRVSSRTPGAQGRIQTLPLLA